MLQTCGAEPTQIQRQLITKTRPYEDGDDNEFWRYLEMRRRFDAILVDQVTHDGRIWILFQRQEGCGLRVSRDEAFVAEHLVIVGEILVDTDDPSMTL